MFSSSNCSSFLISFRRLADAGVVQEAAKAEETLIGSIEEDGNGREFETEIAGVEVVLEVVVEFVLEVVVEFVLEVVVDVSIIVILVICELLSLL